MWVGGVGRIGNVWRKMRVPGQGKSIVNPDIIIVPGLAFDESGNRLGEEEVFTMPIFGIFTGEKLEYVSNCSWSMSCQ